MTNKSNPDHIKSNFSDTDSTIGEVLDAILKQHNPSNVNIFELFESYYQMLLNELENNVDIRQQFAAMTRLTKKNQTNPCNINIEIALERQPFFPVLDNPRLNRQRQNQKFVVACRDFWNKYENNFYFRMGKNNIKPCFLRLMSNEERQVFYMQEGYFVYFEISGSDGRVAFGDYFRNPGSPNYRDSGPHVQLNAKLFRADKIRLLITPYWGDDR